MPLNSTQKDYLKACREKILQYHLLLVLQKKSLILFNLQETGLLLSREDTIYKTTINVFFILTQNLQLCDEEIIKINRNLSGITHVSEDVVASSLVENDKKIIDLLTELENDKTLIELDVSFKELFDKMENLLLEPEEIQENNINHMAPEEMEENGDNHMALEEIQENGDNHMAAEEIQENVNYHIAPEEIQENGNNHMEAEEIQENGDNHMAPEENQENGDNHMEAEEIQENGDNHMEAEEILENGDNHMVAEEIQENGI